MHALTVDLEEWFHGVELRQADWPSESRLRVGLERLRTLLERQGVSATFFVLGAVAEREPALVAELERDGHEIGCHGYVHEFVYRQSPRCFRADVRRARDLVGNAVGHSPAGYRAPYFSIRRDSLWALEILIEEGFIYDSSVFPVRNYRYGIADAPRSPYAISTAAGTLVEAPVTAARILGQNLPFSGGSYLRLLPWWVQRVGWRVVANGGVNVIAYVHPWELDPDHPRVELPWRIRATHYARLDVTERRLEQLLSLHRFGRLDEVLGLRIRPGESTTDGLGSPS